jgi:transposase
VFLPKYSPDLNPIEQAFAKFKHGLRKAKARTYDAISDATADILKRFPSSECGRLPQKRRVCVKPKANLENAIDLSCPLRSAL